MSVAIAKVVQVAPPFILTGVAAAGSSICGAVRIKPLVGGTITLRAMIGGDITLRPAIEGEIKLNVC